MGPGRRPLGVTVGGDRWWPLGLAAGPVRGVRPREGAVGDTSKGVCLEGDCSFIRYVSRCCGWKGFLLVCSLILSASSTVIIIKKISNVFKSV